MPVLMGKLLLDDADSLEALFWFHEASSPAFDRTLHVEEGLTAITSEIQTA